MTNDLLTHYRVGATTDLDQARDQVSRHFCAHRLSLGHRDSHLDLVHNSATIGRDVTLNYMRYGSEVHITPGRLEDFFLVQAPIAGSARVCVGDRVVPSDRWRASVASPTEPVDMVWSDDCEKLVVYIRREALEAVAATADDDAGPLVFEPVLDLAAPTAQAWMRLVRYAVDALSGPSASIFESTLVAANLEQTIISGLLTIQPNSSHATRTPTTVTSRAVRTALELIEENPEHPWRVDELATLAGVSARTLQELFARELDTTPRECIRRTRLGRARTELLAADPATTSVAEIATRWGFFHLGRFAHTYREHFGELPSATLAQ
ncbi:AraC family transcriptional regulator [Gordonia sp. NPDC003376]